MAIPATLGTSRPWATRPTRRQGGSAPEGSSSPQLDPTFGHSQHAEPAAVPQPRFKASNQRGRLGRARQSGPSGPGKLGPVALFCLGETGYAGTQEREKVIRREKRDVRGSVFGRVGDEGSGEGRASGSPGGAANPAGWQARTAVAPPPTVATGSGKAGSFPGNHVRVLAFSRSAADGGM
jgi:hypothetical protein